MCIKNSHLKVNIVDQIFFRSRFEMYMKKDRMEEEELKKLINVDV